MVNGLYPFEGRYFGRDGLRQHYLDEGSGEAVVMLHGNPTWSFYYRNLVLALRDTHRAIAPDHIGCGRSDKPGDNRYDYTLESRVNDLEALLDHLEITQDITLVLHDWGGMIGMAYALRRPERIKRLVILNTSAFSLPSGKSFPWPLWIVRNTPLGAILVRGFNAFAATAARVCCTRTRMSKEVRKAYIEPYNSWANRIATLRFVQDIPLKPGDPSHNRVREVEEKVGLFRDTPTLICWGMKDFVFDHTFLQRWEEALPQAQIHRFEDCGHYILEDASEEVIALVRNFVTDGLD